MTTGPAAGLTVRWSLSDAPPAAAQALRDYVSGTSLERFTGLAGLRHKTWRMVEGAWFEGSYVFADARSRDEFAAAFRTTMDSAPGTQIVGSPPVLVEACEVLAVAEGAEGFRADRPTAS